MSHQMSSRNQATSSINLFAFPLIIIKLIYQLMTVEERFFLSLTSKKVHRSIKLFKYDASGVQFIFGDDGFRLCFGDVYKSMYRIQTMHPKTICICTMESTKPICKFGYGSKTNFVEEIHKYIYDLFQRSHLKLSVTIHSFFYYTWLPTVKRARFRDESVKTKRLEKFLATHPELETLMTDKKILGNIYPESRVFKVKHLLMRLQPLPFTEYLRHFKGKSVSFQSSKNAAAHIREFMRKWLNAEYSESLKNLYVIQSAYEDSYDLSILEPFRNQLKVWEKPGKWPSCPELDHHLRIERDPWDNRVPMYIRREMDGKIAFLRLAPRCFTFCVLD